MAGNTKILGFVENNKLAIERWGKTEIIELPGEAIKVLRDVCYRALPKEPPKPKPTIPRAEYDPSFGWTVVVVPPDVGDAMAKLLTQSTDPLIQDLALQLARTAEEHHRFLDTSGEPGVEETKHEVENLRGERSG